MTFWILLLILGVLVFPILRRRLTEKLKLKYWESAFISFSAIFVVVSFFPVFGAPLVHPMRGEVIVQGRIISTAFIPALVFLITGCFLIIRRKLATRLSKKRGKRQ